MLHSSVFGQSWNTHQQTMPFAEHGDQQFINHLVLPDDDFPDFRSHSLVGSGKSSDCLFFQLFRCDIFCFIGTLFGMAGHCVCLTPVDVVG